MKTLIAMQNRLIVDELLCFLSEQTWVYGSDIFVVHVLDPLPGGYYADFELYDRTKKDAENMVADLVAHIEQLFPGLTVNGLVVQGEPKQEIVRLAREMPADLIIMGSRPRGLFGRIFLGSVSGAVHASSSCSVMVLRGWHLMPQQSATARGDALLKDMHESAEKRLVS